MSDWEVQRNTGRCAVTGRELAEGEEFYAVLVDRDGVLERADYSLDAWTEPPADAFCVWKSRVPVRAATKPVTVDNETLVQLLHQTADATDEAKVNFRFVLALLLMRKKLLRYEGSRTEDGRELWQMRLVADQSTVEVENPRMTDAQISAVSAQLTAVLAGGSPDDAPAPTPDAGSALDAADAPTPAADTASAPDANATAAQARTGDPA